MLQALGDSFGGDSHRLLTHLSNAIGARIAYVDRPTVGAHLEPPVSDREWVAATQQFKAMAFDDYVEDAGSLRTDWIEDVLARAGVSGSGYTSQPVAVPPLGRA